MYRGHTIAVSRSELTRGFSIRWDGRLLGRRWWTLLGAGELAVEADVDGARVPVVARLEPISQCRLTVGGDPVETRRTR